MKFLRLLPSYWCTPIYFFSLFLNANSILAEKVPSSIAVFDWTIAETLLSLDPAAVSLGNTAAFHTWTGYDYEDINIIDIGTQIFPNMELLSNISPEQILLSPNQTRLGERLHEIAPITILQSYPYTRERNGSLWLRLETFTLDVGKAANLSEEAQQLVSDTRLHLESLKNDIPPQPPLLIIQLVNEHHVRIYGADSMFQGVLEQLGLKNAWTGNTNQWGYSLVSIRELFNVNEARLVILESAFPIGIENNIENSGAWHFLPSVQRGDFVVLPSSFWIAGALPSSLRFADSLVRALRYN